MTFLIIFLFVLGAVWGSFLNVVIVRSVKGLSFVTGRSRCDKCKHQLAWFDNIPLVSYLILRGKCRYCHKGISTMNPLVEVITGLFFVWWFVVGFGFFRLIGSPYGLIQPVFWLVVGMCFLIIFVTDLFYMIIPFYLNMFLLSVVLVYRVLLVNFGYMQVADFLESVLTGVGLATFFVIVNKIVLKLKGVEGFGMGDVWLSPALGMILGFPRALVAFFLSFVIGSVVAVYLLATKKRSMGQYLPFGPFLIAGTVLSLVYGERIIVWYLGNLI